MPNPPKVIIAGAGPVGLVAARILSAHGIAPHIFERRQHPSFRSQVPGMKARGEDSAMTGPAPWASRDRTRGIALVGPIIDAIMQRCGLDLVQCDGLVQFEELVVEFQTAVPAILRIVEVIAANPDVLTSEALWSTAMSRIDGEHGEFVDKILAMSDVIGRPIDDEAFQREAASLSFA